MSGIYIHGMEMPKNREIMLRIDETGEVYVYGAYPTELYKAIPAPGHGDLVARDALREKAYNSGMWANGHEGFKQMVVDLEDINNAPTIIPASKEAPDERSTQ